MRSATSRALVVVDGFVPVDDCASLLSAIASHLDHRVVPLVHREHGDRPLRYQVVDGLAVERALPTLRSLVAPVRVEAERLTGATLVPVADIAVSLNVNIMPPGGSYRWHYDRNPYTALLYLDTIAGGELEVYPNHRLRISSTRGRVQRGIDCVASTPVVRHALGRRTVVAPRAGRLVVMRGDRCLHSVAPVRGPGARVCVVFAFDCRRGRRARSNPALDTYLYSSAAQPAHDPNYRPPRGGQRTTRDPSLNAATEGTAPARAVADGR